MHRVLGKSFNYDVVLSLNDSYKLAERYENIKGKYSTARTLAATFNHRFYDIHSKNFIKNFVDINCLDHIMFSMRPSSRQLLVDNLSGYEIQEFEDLSQLIFILQLLSRYNLPTAIVDASYLNIKDENIENLDYILKQVELFLGKLYDRFCTLTNVHKQWPALYSIKKLFPSLHNKKIILLSSISLDLQPSQEKYSFKQINELEKDLFWLGFDPKYKEVPHHKKYLETKWTRLAKNSVYGKGLFEEQIKYCSRCCLPETMEGIELDELGVCVPCRSSEDKMHINWENRGQLFRELIDSYKTDEYYDCMLPMSGGKDSTYQAHILSKIANVTSLAVTSGHGWHSLIGRYNLENCLQKFDLDHLYFVKSRDVINKAAKKSLREIGDACWHCHVAAGAFTVQAALVWDVKLMCWGESIAEADGRGSYSDRLEASKETSLQYNLEISAIVKAEDMVDELISEEEMSAWMYPPESSLKKCIVKYIHVGDYFFWDEERQVEFIKRNYEWMDYKVENAYKGYKSVECVMAGVHDYFNFIKRGIGRSTVQAAQDIRRGLMTREEGIEVAKKYDSQRPHALDYYLKITGYTEEEIEYIIGLAREKSNYAKKLHKKNNSKLGNHNIPASVEEYND